MHATYQGTEQTSLLGQKESNDIVLVTDVPMLSPDKIGHVLSPCKRPCIQHTTVTKKGADLSAWPEKPE